MGMNPKAVVLHEKQDRLLATKDDLRRAEASGASEAVLRQKQEAAVAAEMRVLEAEADYRASLGG